METTMLKFPVTSTNDTTITFQLNPTTFGTSGADVLFGKDFAPRFWWDTWSYDDELFGFGGSDKLFGVPATTNCSAVQKTTGSGVAKAPMCLMAAAASIGPSTTRRVRAWWRVFLCHQ
jgi:Ca2+-binding RTX toxin-like protein